MKVTSKTFDLAGKTLTLETGRLATQASAAVLGRLGDTMVLTTVVASKKETTLDYFPLSVEYVERLYAGGRIKGSRWVKREGRPSDDAVLKRRLIDRSIRPLFPKEYKNDVQVVITVLSVDGENEPDILALITVSAALSISPIPWNGPVGAVRMGYVKNGDNGGEILVNPGGPEQDLSELDLVVTQIKNKTIMLEAGANQVPEEIIAEAIEKAHPQTKAIIDFIEEFTKEAGQKKIEVKPDTTLHEYVAKIEKNYKKEIEELVAARALAEGYSKDQDLLVEKIFSDEQVANPGESIEKKTIGKAVEKVFFKVIRTNTLTKSKRPDGRKLDEIRPLGIDIGVLPRTHGSAIFQRGDTQVLSIATLGASRLEQLIESAEGEEKKRYMHHYYFPPYSVGETGRMFGPGPREIGHGALAERALEAVIPSQDIFPYAIRVVSETLSSNGSTSMAATCGSTLALMDAGVPILKPVAGISIGRVQEGDDYKLITDILGLEDFSGDMDFKVAGTDSGVTAIQLDVKDAGLTVAQIKETFEMAKVARLFILEKMIAAIPSFRAEVSEYAPKISMLRIPVEKIGELIGPGGKVIKNIIATTGAQVDVEDDGSVSISGVNEDQVKAAVNWIQGLTREVTVGEIFQNAEVKRILPFGAFVEFLPGKEGMVHVSQMSTDFVNNPNDVVSIGQKVTARVIQIDDQGRINLSMLAEGEVKAQAPRSEQPHREFREKSMHPLSMQFQREQRTQKPFTRGPQRSKFKR